MIVKEKEFQRILALNPKLIANTMGIDPDIIKIESVEFVYGRGILNPSSRFDIVLRVTESKDKFRDIFLELKTLDGSSSYEQIQKYNHIIKNDDLNQLAKDSQRELHFMVLECEFGYPKLQSYLDRFHTANDDRINLYVVKENEFIEYLKRSGEDKFEINYFTNEYKVSDLQLDRIGDFFKGEGNQSYLLNFINYLTPKYGAEVSARYSNAADYFYKVFAKFISTFEFYDEIEIGENKIHKPGNSRTINFKYGNKTLLSMFANSYPLQLKLFLADGFEIGINHFETMNINGNSLSKTIKRANYRYETSDERWFAQAYPAIKKRELFVRLDNYYEHHLDEVDEIIDNLNSLFGKIYQ